MSVQAPTTPATSAAPQQQTAPQQPWAATGLTYYHNQYVQRAADLGCCGVTHLLVVQDSSLPATIGKIAVFAIVSVGFAIYDVLHAVWEKLSCSRTVTAITPPTNNTAPNTDASSTKSSQDPAKSKSAKGKDDVSDEEETTSSSVDLNELTTEFNLDNPAATAASITANYGILTSAIDELRKEVVKRPDADVMRRAITQLENGLNNQNAAIQGMLNDDYRSISHLRNNIARIEQLVEPLTIQINGAMNIAKTMAPELAKKVEEEVHALADSQAKGKKSSDKAADQADDASGPEEGEKASKKAAKKSDGAKPVKKPESKTADDDAGDGIVPPFLASGNFPPPSVSAIDPKDLEKIYAKLQQETYAIGMQLGRPHEDVVKNCNSMGHFDLETETIRLGNLKDHWTNELYIRILNEVNGIKLSEKTFLQTSSVVQQINTTYPEHDARLEQLRKLVEEVAPKAETVLKDEISEKAGQLNYDLEATKKELDKRPHRLARLVYLKEVVGILDQGLAKLPKQPPKEPTLVVVPPAQ